MQKKKMDLVQMHLTKEKHFLSVVKIIQYHDQMQLALTKGHNNRLVIESLLQNLKNERDFYRSRVQVLKVEAKKENVPTMFVKKFFRMLSMLVRMLA